MEKPKNINGTIAQASIYNILKKHNPYFNVYFDELLNASGSMNYSKPASIVTGNRRFKVHVNPIVNTLSEDQIPQYLKKRMKK